MNTQFLAERMGTVAPVNWKKLILKNPVIRESIDAYEFEFSTKDRFQARKGKNKKDTSSTSLSHTHTHTMAAETQRSYFVILYSFE